MADLSLNDSPPIGRLMPARPRPARTFRSDNNAGLCPEAMEAIRLANDGGHEPGYGDDACTRRALAAFHAIFGEQTSVWFVATGTAANTLAIAALTEPWQQVICHAHCHYNFDESTAPERITHCRMVPVSTSGTKLTPTMVASAATGTRGDVHQPQAGVVSISNPTEFGTVYTPDELRALCDAAHAMGYRVHVDGARFANAVASLGCHPRELAGAAGVDALSFGGTKNGLALGEAVLFFPQGDGSSYQRAVRTFAFHRKGTGHLLSKHRFVSAPFAQVLGEGAWLRHAAHANAMARRLGEGLAARGHPPATVVEANAVFVRWPAAVDACLKAAGHGYYPFAPPDAQGRTLFRLMCSFDTQPHEVDAFLADVERATGD
jgi:threonine aldolase